ncbi:response regulator transcription factor [Candidatus Terasakiella magnetica]|nr:response regulator [Candidatus Terasakiella magnetica]
MNILIVDDCPRMVSQLSSLFKKHPVVHKVAGAKSFTEAVNQCNRLHFHIVLIDYDLQDNFNGIDVCRWIRKQNPDCIIIFVSGFPSAQVMEEAFAAGTNDFIKKPLLPSEVRIKVFYWWELMKSQKNSKAFLDYHGLKYIFKSNEFYADRRVLPLTKGLKRLLLLFLEKPETVISHDILQREVWGDFDTALRPRNIHERIGSLRQNLPNKFAIWLQSIRGEGYILKRGKAVKL